MPFIIHRYPRITGCTMTKDELKRLYTKDDNTGCWSWNGPSKVRYTLPGEVHSRTWYPHILLWVLTKQPAIPTGKALHRTCATDNCISPHHHTIVDKHLPIAPYRYTHAHVQAQAPTTATTTATV